MTTRAKVTMLLILFVLLALVRAIHLWKEEQHRPAAPEQPRVAVPPPIPRGVVWDYEASQLQGYVTTWHLCVNGRCREMRRVTAAPIEKGEKYELRATMTTEEAIAVQGGASLSVRACRMVTAEEERCAETPLVR